MKKIVLTLIPLFIGFQNRAATTYLLDKIEAIAYTQEGTEVVTKSDVDRPSLGGGMRSRDDIIFENLIFLDAKKYKIMPDEAAVDKYLQMVQRENNLTLDDLKTIFNQAGRTYEEGREEFKHMQAVNSMLSYKIQQNLIVPRKAIEAYYNEHPEKQEAEYILEYALVQFVPGKDKQEQKKALERVARTSIGIADIVWSDSFSIKQSDVSEDKSFIFSMEPGDISMPHEVAAGFELYKLKEKKEERVLTLDERYQDIADILRRPKYEELMQQYKDALFDGAAVIYF